MLAFEDTGAYRLLLPAMSEDPAELAALLHRDGRSRSSPTTPSTRPTSCRRSRRSSSATATSPAPPQRLYTHRHTVRYRLERVRDLSGLDVGSTDGRERLGLGLKAMRVLGIASPQGPASEAGAGAGRVRRGAKDR